jgi:hypothetical protein
MGEYAKHNGKSIKIGTCEQMYYLRADQVHLITPEPNSVNPQLKSTAEQIRFRFPFPSEDGTEPGGFEDHGRAHFVSGAEVPDGVDHGSLQFTRNYPAAGGVILSTPCPLSKEGKASGLKFHFNGYSGDVGIHSQRLVDGQLKLVCKCGGCGALWRMDTLEDCRGVLDSLESTAASLDHRNRIANEAPGAVQCKSSGDYYREIARRIVAGYEGENYWTKRPAAPVTA